MLLLLLLCPAYTRTVVGESMFFFRDNIFFFYNYTFPRALIYFHWFN